MYVALQVVHSSCFFRDATLGRSGVAAAEPRTLLAGRTSASESSSVVSAAIPSMRGAVEGVSAGARVAAHRFFSRPRGISSSVLRREARHQALREAQWR